MAIIYYVTTSFNRPVIIVFITYVSYTDIEIEYKSSDEEVTDCVGKLKMHLKETKYVLVMFYAALDVMVKWGNE